MNNPVENKMQQHTEEDSIDLKLVFSKLSDKWMWFVSSVFACLLIAFLYTCYVPPTYQITAKLLVNDDDKGGGLGKQAGSLMDLGGILGSKSSVDNEAEILQTRFLMEQVVRQLQLNIVYQYKNGFTTRELYNAPFKLLIVQGVDTISKTQLNIEPLTNGKLRVISKDFERDVKWNETFRIEEVGTVKLIQETGVQVPKVNYVIKINSIDERVGMLMSQLLVGVTNKQGTIIDLGLSYALPKKGEDILNALINNYVQTNLGDKNSIADSTYKFIRERINIIASELGDVENEVETFKQNNKLADMSEQSKLLVQNTGEFTTELAKAETQVSILNDLESYLKDQNKNKRVFPTSLLPSDLVFSGMMEQYNSLLLERDKQLLSVTEESPFIHNIDNQISGLRKGILANIQSTKNTFVLTRNKLRTQLSTVETQIGGVPQVEKNYLKLARNQKIKQELYIFLMQKAEETAISKTANLSIAKVIDPPKSQFLPISPKKNVILLAGFVIGLIFPILLIFGLELYNTTISTKDDISKHTQVPVVGEISHNLSMDSMVVANQGRSAISEQFRALRTNLSFYLKDHDQKVILLTSSMSGEGKSFTAVNLGNILALTDKKVVLLEFDLRKPGLSSKLKINNSLGFSNYTINESLKITDILRPLDINKNMSIISSGPLPPNPAETLMSSRTQTLIEELKKQFDYIIIDAPPIGIITDAQLLSQYADVTLYLVRQKVTRKDQLAIVEDLYRNGKMTNLGIVVNDIVSKYYGYGYGYGTYGEEQTQSKIQKFFKRSNS
ncbi:capsular exopolysaccharide family [Pedobacter westerhofensis]|uniref:non-specific protein-tyrosine kinase n=1 Tax=Pedobacter westerhofensis TaxID=425512 RepID=A0A521C8L5_9SPHI|nr:tyrosine-protein kinase [Pedobacter westerhofensis]SMO55837.1 capsular exopolysaccharide family [Pedobacter westerhofensis]